MVACRVRLGLVVAEQGLQMPSGLLWAIRYLTPLVNVPVRGDIPKDRPAAFVLVSGAGGADGLVTGSAQLLVECWSSSVVEAEALALRVSALLSKAPGVTVSGVQCRGFTAVGLPHFLPDPDAQVPRWRQNVALTFRKTTI
jgi:hypothetical protein